ncbi:MAG: ECF-type sigma factor [Pyrinomonadaceae bacterium]
MKESVKRPDQSITQLLVKWGGGDKAALDELIPLVYDELRKLAASYLRRKAGPHTIQATALVHEAYIRLADQSSISMEHRAQFYGLAAKVMRDILVDHARKRLSAKRGGDQLRLSLTDAERFGHKPDVELVALDDALKVLAATNPQHNRVIELRFFGGLTIEETAQVMSFVTRHDGTLLEFCSRVVATRACRLGTWKPPKACSNLRSSFTKLPTLDHRSVPILWHGFGIRIPHWQ